MTTLRIIGAVFLLAGALSFIVSLKIIALKMKGRWLKLSIVGILGMCVLFQAEHSYILISERPIDPRVFWVQGFLVSFIGLVMCLALLGRIRNGQ